MILSRFLTGMSTGLTAMLFWRSRAAISGVMSESGPRATITERTRMTKARKWPGGPESSTLGLVAPTRMRPASEEQDRTRVGPVHSAGAAPAPALLLLAYKGLRGRSPFPGTQALVEDKMEVKGHEDQAEGHDRLHHRDRGLHQRSGFLRLRCLLLQLGSAYQGEGDGNHDAPDDVHAQPDAPQPRGEVLLEHAWGEAKLGQMAHPLLLESLPNVDPSRSQQAHKYGEEHWAD